jgi:hypothetical protein
MRKWFRPIIPKGRAKRILPTIDKFFIGQDFGFTDNINDDQQNS